MTWRMPANEQWLFDDVVTHNEYLLPDDMKGWRVLDVGGHAGCFARMCLERGVSAIHSYEPCWATFEMHATNLMGLGYQPGIHRVFREAVVGNRWAKVVRLNHWVTAAGHSLHWGEGGEDAPAVFIDDALRRLGGPCDLLKLDCEGSEYDIIGGSRLPDVKRLAVEFHVGPQKFWPAIWRLDSLGFKQTRLEVAHPEMGWFRLYWGERA